jgi:ABC-type sugar transport system permease subunit
LGYSSAISFALLAVILLATLLMKRAGRRSE